MFIDFKVYVVSIVVQSMTPQKQNMKCIPKNMLLGGVNRDRSNKV